MVFILRGVFYIGFLPLWEGFDEWSHYAVIQNMASGGRWIINRSDPISREVQASLELAPWVNSPGQFDTYWRLPEPERARREKALQSLPLSWGSQPTARGPNLYEAQQTPLYYWLLLPAYKSAAGLSFLARVWLLRVLSLLIASAVVPLTFYFARAVFGNEWQALSVAGLLAAMPQVMMTVCHITNDSLAVPIGSLLLLTLFRWKQAPRSILRALALGVALGLSLLAKAYFLAVLPPVMICAAIWAPRNLLWRSACTVAGAPMVIAGWWYIRTWTLTHSLSGDQIEMAGSRTGPGLAAAALQTNWFKAVDFAFISQIWLGNWSFLVVRSWMYHFLESWIVLAAIGVLVSLWRRSTPDLKVLVSLYLSFAAALAYHSVRNLQSEGFSGTLGYYMFAIVAAEAVLLIAGLETLTPALFKPALVPAGVVCLLGVELFGTHFYSIPYYTGFTSHLPDGKLPALKIHGLYQNIPAMLARLAINKPAFLDRNVMAVCWLLFLAGTIGLAVLTFRVAWLRAAANGFSVPGTLSSPHTDQRQQRSPRE